MNEPERIPVVNIYEATDKSGSSNTNPKIYVRAVKGVIETFRRYVGVFFIGIFLLIPWLTFNDQQAVMLNFVEQRFHFFNVSLWPQDLTIFAWVFIIAAFTLFFITVIFGRVWCGFMCPQTVFTFLFVWVEEFVEGTRHKRIHLDKQNFSIAKLTKKSVKHFSWLCIALITSLTFVGYFMPIRELFHDFLTINLSFWPAFYIALFMFCTYANAGWMREIMCTHICPYARFQSAMFDKDTYTVTYNDVLGEGRGPRSKKLSKTQYNDKGLGDCIDCNLCVQVCPTGIDIRNGLQYECINCGACVDACNDVMSKMDYPLDLISFTTQSTLSGEPPRITRPKVIGYFVVLIIMTGALVFDMVTRKTLDVGIIRDRNTLFNETFSGEILNVYNVLVRNKGQTMQNYQISLDGLPNAYIIGETNVTVNASQHLVQPITVAIDPQYLTESITGFKIVISNQQGDAAKQETNFIYTDL
jgi:cytochrome c oxidase accessory protein FixG